MMMETKDKIIVDGVSFFYGSNRVIDKVNARFKAHTLTAVTGPSGQGKSTLLGMFNGLWSDTPASRVPLYGPGAKNRGSGDGT